MADQGLGTVGNAVSLLGVDIDRSDLARHLAHGSGPTALDRSRIVDPLGALASTVGP